MWNTKERIMFQNLGEVSHFKQIEKYLLSTCTIAVDHKSSTGHVE